MLVQKLDEIVQKYKFWLASIYQNEVLKYLTRNMKIQMDESVTKHFNIWVHAHLIVPNVWMEKVVQTSFLVAKSTYSYLHYTVCTWDFTNEG